MMMINVHKKMNFLCKMKCENPHEASRRSRIFLILLEYVCVFIYLCHACWPNEKQYIPEIWHTYHHWPYLKRVICFIEEIPVTATSLEKTAVSRGFSAYLLDCLVFDFFTKSSQFSSFCEEFPVAFFKRAAPVWTNFHY